MKLEFSRHIFETKQMSNFMKIRPVGADLFHADRRIDMTKLMVAFRNFANAPKNSLSYDTQAHKILIPTKLYEALSFYKIFPGTGHFKHGNEKKYITTSQWSSTKLQLYLNSGIGIKAKNLLTNMQMCIGFLFCTRGCSRWTFVITFSRLIYRSLH